MVARLESKSRGLQLTLPVNIHLRPNCQQAGQLMQSVRTNEKMRNNKSFRQIARGILIQIKTRLNQVRLCIFGSQRGDRYGRAEQHARLPELG